MAERNSSAVFRARATSASSSTRRTMRMSIASSEPRETWLCRSTIGAGDSDVDEDDEMLSEGFEECEESCNELRQPSTIEPNRCGDCDSNGVPTCDSIPPSCTPSSHCSSSSPIKVRRKLSLNDHFSNENALRKNLALNTRYHDGNYPVTPHSTSSLTSTPLHHAKQNQRLGKMSPTAKTKVKMVLSRSCVEGDQDDAKKKQGGNEDVLDHLAIHVGYERQVGSVFRVDSVRRVYVTLFLSTATIHSTVFNISPGLRRLFGINALPVGLTLVLSWILFGITGFIGGCFGDYVRDRVVLLRQASVIWAVAVAVLQTARVPMPDGLTNTLVIAGFIGALIGHGVIVPNAMALGAQAAMSSTPSSTLCHQSTVTGAAPSSTNNDGAISRYFTRCFASNVTASSVVQAIYVLSINLDNGDSKSPLLRSRRAFFVRLCFGLLLFLLLVVFLYQSRHHRNALSAPGAMLERKITCELSATTSMSIRELGRLCRRAFVLYVLIISVFLMLLGTAATLIVHVTRTSSTSPIVHVFSFALIFVGWLATILISTNQLSPKSKLFVRCRAMDLPTQPIQMILVLLSLGAATVFAAFVRAQLYTTMFVQTCQLRLGLFGTAVRFEPNIIGALVGFLSIAAIPVARLGLYQIRWVVRRCRRRQPTANNVRLSVVITPSRRASIGILFYVVGVFVSGVVELYRRSQPQLASAHITTTNHPSCPKTTSADFSVLCTTPHLVVLALADALFRLGAIEEVQTLTSRTSWIGFAQGVLVLAESVGYAAALCLSSSLSWWLYRGRPSDLVLLLLLLTSLGAFAYALMKQLAERLVDEAIVEHDLNCEVDGEVHVVDQL